MWFLKSSLFVHLSIHLNLIWTSKSIHTIFLCHLQTFKMVKNVNCLTYTFPAEVKHSNALAFDVSSHTIKTVLFSIYKVPHIFICAYFSVISPFKMAPKHNTEVPGSRCTLIESTGFWRIYKAIQKGKKDIPFLNKWWWNHWMSISKKYIPRYRLYTLHKINSK